MCVCSEDYGGREGGEISVSCGASGTKEEEELSL